MRKFILLIPTFLCLTCCQNKAQNEIKIEYQYEDFEEYKIEWKNLFFTAKSHYFVYIYSEYCLHCMEMKQYILPYFVEQKSDMFLIQYSSEILCDFETQKTIGATSVENVWIIGVPTLIEIDNGVVVNNVAGKEDILNLLECKND